MPTLNGILLDARRCNEHEGVTGALVCRDDIYLQLLEGPAAAVGAAYARICLDDRHVNPTELVNRPISNRLFADWAMLHDPANSWIWSREELSEGILKSMPAETAVKVFEDLAAQVRDGAST